MKSQSFHHHLRPTPIAPHAGPGIPGPASRFGKAAVPPGDPVAAPKPSPRYIPPPITNLTNLTLPLDLVVPDEAKAATDAGVLVFHAVGDTGGIHGDDVEKAISTAMDRQITDAVKAQKPAPGFFYNLGDVIYFNGESTLYESQFYEPYQNYHAAIFAIAGNHDGDTQTRPGDPVDREPTLFGFMRNFCDSSSHNDSAYRATMTQPYVYWTLDAPFVTIIGLYSNVDGTLDARGTSEQQQWFEQQVKVASPDKALLFAVHHAPYSLDTTHRGYPDIEAALDRAIQATGRMPTAVLSGHVHSYQRYERDLGGKKIPYIVAGAGGYANTPKLLHKIEKGIKLAAGKGNKPKSGSNTTHPDLNLEQYNDQEPGFLRITIDSAKKNATFDYFLVPFTAAAPATPFDTVSVPW